MNGTDDVRASFVPVAELTEMYPTHSVKDSAYRRGFVHGLCEAIDAFGDGASVTALAHYVDYLMEHWRYCDTDRLIIPPSFGEWAMRATPSAARSAGAAHRKRDMV